MRVFSFVVVFFFFFKPKTAYEMRISDWSSDVCSSDLPQPEPSGELPAGGRMLGHEDVDLFTLLPAPAVEGLQVFNRRSMKWIRLTAPAGSIILNTGEIGRASCRERVCQSV